MLPIFCALWLGFILSNSLRTGEESSAQSSTVVAAIQQVAQTIAPESEIANATGEAYLRLHIWVRKAAHFIEYAVWGSLLRWCYFVYTKRKKFIFLPVLGVVVLPILDESLQKFVSGRAGMLADAFIDLAGGITGFLAAWGILLLIAWLMKRKRKKEEGKS